MALTDDQKTEAQSLNESVFESTSLHRPKAGMGRVSPMGAGTYGGYSKWEARDPSTGAWTDFYVVSLFLGLLLFFCPGALAQTIQPESSTSLGFIKPEYIAGSWGDKINQNWDLLNQELLDRPETIDCDLETQTLLYDNDTDTWSCGDDDGSVILDLGDDAANESTEILEFATTGDTEAIFTEPSADKLLFDATKVVSPDRVQTLTNKTLTIPGITGFTVVGLPPAGTAGRIARLTDGQRAGRLVIDDGTAWRCLDDVGGSIIDPYCPPYNVQPRAGTAASVTGIQAAIDRMKLGVTGGNRAFKCIDLGEDVIILPGSILYDTDNSTNLFCVFSNGNGGFQFTEDNAAHGLRIAGTGQTNVVWMVNISISGGGSNTGPLKLVDCDECVQVWIDRIRLGDNSFTGLSFTGGGHVSITNSLFSENAVGDADAAYVRVYGSLVDLHMSGNMSEGVSASSTNCHLAVADTGSINVLEFHGNTERGAGIRCLIDTSESNTSITKASITGNVAIGVTQACFDFRGGNANSAQDIAVTGNSCSCLTAGTGDFFFAANDLESSVISNNTSDQCGTGIRLAGATTDVLAANNVFTNVETYGVDIQNDSTNVKIDGLLVDGAATADVNIGAGTSGGGNLIKGVVATDGSPPIYNIASTGWDHATDMVELADGVQQETCGATLNLTPAYKNIQLAVTASPCVITLIEPNANGFASELLVVSTSGTTADIASDGSIAKLDAGAAWNGGVGDILNVKYNKALAYFYETGRSNN